jgi:acyl carrier protein
MLDNGIEPTLRAVFASVFDIDGRVLSDDDSPRSIAAWDSVSHIHLLMTLEQEFKVRFEPEEFAELTSYGAILRWLEAHRSPRV